MENTETNKDTTNSSIIKNIISYFADPNSEMLYEINNAAIQQFKDKFDNKSQLDPQDPWFAIVNDPLKCMKFLKELIKNQKDIESNIKQHLKNKKECKSLVKAEIDSFENKQNPDEEIESETNMLQKVTEELAILESKLESETDPVKRKKYQRKIDVCNNNKNFFMRKNAKL